uniref:Transmembrane protein n=1 Tax=Heterorhabditis bacteriophora TaxID=37862 RepID=A0A1I7X990_HETBA
MCAAAVQSLAHCSALTVKEKKAPGERDVPSSDIVKSTNSLFLVIFKCVVEVKYVTKITKQDQWHSFETHVRPFERPRCFIARIDESCALKTECALDNVTVNRIHLFTFIQILLLILVYTVKHFKESAVAFPFVLMLFILFRQTALRWIFTEKELETVTIPFVPAVKVVKYGLLHPQPFSVPRIRNPSLASFDDWPWMITEGSR